MMEGTMVTNKQIYDARTALAKIANTDLPLPLILSLAPLLDACEPVIEKAEGIRGKAEDDGEFERYMGGMRELPSCVIPALPEFRMSYVELKRLEGIATIEEVT